MLCCWVSVRVTPPLSFPPHLFQAQQCIINVLVGSQRVNQSRQTEITYWPAVRGRVCTFALSLARLLPRRCLRSRPRSSASSATLFDVPMFSSSIVPPRPRVVDWQSFLDMEGRRTARSGGGGSGTSGRGTVSVSLAFPKLMFNFQFQFPLSPPRLPARCTNGKEYNSRQKT